MEQISIELLPQGIGPSSSMTQLRSEFHRIGLLQYPTGRLKDAHFQTYILPVGLKSMGDVKAFAAQLDAESRKYPGVSGCAKAKEARKWNAYLHNPEIPKLTWALRSLAIARATPCACHETGSYHPIA